PPPPPLATACASPIPVILPSNGNEVWDSVLHLYQAASPSQLISCGGGEDPVDSQDDVYDSVSDDTFDILCSEILVTLARDEVYWLVLQAKVGNIIPNTTVLVVDFGDNS
ncbi:hypothetical protein QJQ45_024741, partial [Haematococcus lacustris]